MKLTWIWGIGLALTLACVNLAASQERPKRPAPPSLPENEPCLKHLSLSKATEYLDAGAHAYEKNCFACHGTFAYLAARPAIRTTTSTHRQTRQALEEFAGKLAVAKLSPRETPPLRVSQTVMTAAALAQHDAATQGKLHPLTRKALDRIWDLQRDDGGWNWVKKNEPPSESDDHFGVTMAAIGVGTAPDRYADTPQARKGLERIRHYLREHPPATMHQRAMLLLAAGCVEGLMTGEEVKQSVADLFALQQPDGGWAMAGLGDWKRVDGAPLDRTASDGYGTGFAVYVLRRGGRIAADDPRLHKGVLWLASHQRASGCWFTRSPYKNDEVSTYAGTTYAILALDACGEIRDREHHAPLAVPPAKSDDEKGRPPAGPLPKGQRVFTCAHSFHVFVYNILAEMAKGAGIQGHEGVGLSRIGGSRVIQHWDVPEEKNEAKAALRAGKVDVLTLSPIWMPDEGIEKFARLGLEHNPDIRVTVQEFWVPNDTYEPVYPLDTRKKVDHNATRIAELRKQQARYDRDLSDFVRGVNQRLGKDVALIVPVGQAAIALREKIVAGTAPGLKAQWDLFRDSWGHPQPPLQVLAAYCHFAVIYRRSPVGLPLPSSLAKLDSLTEKDKLNRLLQELAWDAVTRHALSGTAR